MDGRPETRHSCDASDLCYELAGGQDTTYKAIHGKLNMPRLMYDYGKYALIADLAPLKIGHALLVTKSHHLSFGFAAGVDPGMARVVERVLAEYRRAFGEVAAIEHGSSSETSSSACVSHAHIHLLPMSIEPLLQVMEKHELSFYEERLWEIPKSFSSEDKSYYLVADQSRSFTASAHQSKLPRHFARIAIAAALRMDLSLADWAVPRTSEKLQATIERWRDG